MADFQALSEACESQASEMVGKSPSTVTVSGLVTHPDANGEYTIAAQTIGGRAYWVKLDAAGQPMYFLYSINEPHRGYAIGTNLHSYVALAETYEEHPSWGEHGGWNELTDSHGDLQPRQVELVPGYSDHDCGEALRLNSPDLTERCFDGKRHSDGSYSTRQTFEELLAAGTGPTECEYDCAETWFDFSERCASFLSRTHPGLADFTRRCVGTHDEMTIYNVDGTLAAGGHDDHFFSAGQGLVFSIDEEPSVSLVRSELALEAEGNHPVAERYDVTKQGAGTHSLEWDSPEHMSGLNIKVEALEGNGTYHLGARIVGTTERLSREAILDRNVLLAMECRFASDCTFFYDSLEMRGGTIPHASVCPNPCRLLLLPVVAKPCWLVEFRSRRLFLPAQVHPDGWFHLQHVGDPVRKHLRRRQHQALGVPARIHVYWYRQRRRQHRLPRLRPSARVQRASPSRRRDADRLLRWPRWQAAELPGRGQVCDRQRNRLL